MPAPDKLPRRPKPYSVFVPPIAILRQIDHFESLTNVEHEEHYLHHLVRQRITDANLYNVALLTVEDVHNASAEKDGLSELSKTQLAVSWETLGLKWLLILRDCVNTLAIHEPEAHGVQIFTAIELIASLADDDVLLGTAVYRPLSDDAASFVQSARRMFVLAREILSGWISIDNEALQKKIPPFRLEELGEHIFDVSEQFTKFIRAEGDAHPSILFHHETLHGATLVDSILEFIDSREFHSILNSEEWIVFGIAYYIASMSVKLWHLYVPDVEETLVDTINAFRSKSLKSLALRTLRCFKESGDRLRRAKIYKSLFGEKTMSSNEQPLHKFEELVTMSPIVAYIMIRLRYADFKFQFPDEDLGTLDQLIKVHRLAADGRATTDRRAVPYLLVDAMRFIPIDTPRYEEERNQSLYDRVHAELLRATPLNMKTVDTLPDKILATLLGCEPWMWSTCVATPPTGVRVESVVSAAVFTEFRQYTTDHTKFDDALAERAKLKVELDKNWPLSVDIDDEIELDPVLFPKSEDTKDYRKPIGVLEKCQWIESKPNESNKKFYGYGHVHVEGFEKDHQRIKKGTRPLDVGAMSSKKDKHPLVVEDNLQFMGVYNSAPSIRVEYDRKDGPAAQFRFEKREVDMFTSDEHNSWVPQADGPMITVSKDKAKQKADMDKHKLYQKSRFLATLRDLILNDEAVHDADMVPVRFTMGETHQFTLLWERAQSEFSSPLKKFPELESSDCDYIVARNENAMPDLYTRTTEGHLDWYTCSKYEPPAGLVVQDRLFPDFVLLYIALGIPGTLLPGSSKGEAVSEDTTTAASDGKEASEASSSSDGKEDSSDNDTVVEETSEEDESSEEAAKKKIVDLVYTSKSKNARTLELDSTVAKKELKLEQGVCEDKVYKLRSFQGIVVRDTDGGIEYNVEIANNLASELSPYMIRLMNSKSEQTLSVRDLWRTLHSLDTDKSHSVIPNEVNNSVVRITHDKATQLQIYIETDKTKFTKYATPPINARHWLAADTNIILHDENEGKLQRLPNEYRWMGDREEMTFGTPNQMILKRDFLKKLCDAESDAKLILVHDKNKMSDMIILGKRETETASEDDATESPGSADQADRYHKVTDTDEYKNSPYRKDVEALDTSAKHVLTLANRVLKEEGENNNAVTEFGLRAVYAPGTGLWSVAYPKHGTKFSDNPNAALLNSAGLVYHLQQLNKKYKDEAGTSNLIVHIVSDDTERKFIGAAKPSKEDAVFTKHEVLYCREYNPDEMPDAPMILSRINDDAYVYGHKQGDEVTYVKVPNSEVREWLLRQSPPKDTNEDRFYNSGTAFGVGYSLAKYVVIGTTTDERENKTIVKWVVKGEGNSKLAFSDSVLADPAAVIPPKIKSFMVPGANKYAWVYGNMEKIEYMTLNDGQWIFGEFIWPNGEEWAIWFAANAKLENAYLVDDSKRYLRCDIHSGMKMDSDQFKNIMDAIENYETPTVNVYQAGLPQLLCQYRGNRFQSRELNINMDSEFFPAFALLFLQSQLARAREDWFPHQAVFDFVVVDSHIIAIKEANKMTLAFFDDETMFRSSPKMGPLKELIRDATPFDLLIFEGLRMDGAAEISVKCLETSAELNNRRINRNAITYNLEKMLESKTGTRYAELLIDDVTTPYFFFKVDDKVVMEALPRGELFEIVVDSMPAFAPEKGIELHDMDNNLVGSNVKTGEFVFNNRSRHKYKSSHLATVLAVRDYTSREGTKLVNNKYRYGQLAFSVHIKEAGGGNVTATVAPLPPRLPRELETLVTQKLEEPVSGIIRSMDFKGQWTISSKRAQNNATEYPTIQIAEESLDGGGDDAVNVRRMHRAFFPTWLHDQLNNKKALLNTGLGVYEVEINGNIVYGAAKDVTFSKTPMLIDVNDVTETDDYRALQNLIASASDDMVIEPTLDNTRPENGMTFGIKEELNGSTLKSVNLRVRVDEQNADSCVVTIRASGTDLNRYEIRYPKKDVLRLLSVLLKFVEAQPDSSVDDELAALMSNLSDFPKVAEDKMKVEAPYNSLSRYYAMVLVSRKDKLATTFYWDSNQKEMCRSVEGAKQLAPLMNASGVERVDVYVHNTNFLSFTASEVTPNMFHLTKTMQAVSKDALHMVIPRPSDIVITTEAVDDHGIAFEFKEDGDTAVLPHSNLQLETGVAYSLHVLGENNVRLEERANLTCDGNYIHKMHVAVLPRLVHRHFHGENVEHLLLAGGETAVYLVKDTNGTTKSSLPGGAEGIPLKNASYEIVGFESSQLVHRGALWIATLQKQQPAVTVVGTSTDIMTHVFANVSGSGHIALRVQSEAVEDDVHREFGLLRNVSNGTAELFGEDGLINADQIPSYKTLVGYVEEYENCAVLSFSKSSYKGYEILAQNGTVMVYDAFSGSVHSKPFANDADTVCMLAFYYLGMANRNAGQDTHLGVVIMDGDKKLVKIMSANKTQMFFGADICDKLKEGWLTSRPEYYANNNNAKILDGLVPLHLATLALQANTFTSVTNIKFAGTAITVTWGQPAEESMDEEVEGAGRNEPVVQSADGDSARQGQIVAAPPAEAIAAIQQSAEERFAAMLETLKEYLKEMQERANAARKEEMRVLREMAQGPRLMLETLMREQLRQLEAVAQQQALTSNESMKALTGTAKKLLSEIKDSAKLPMIEFSSLIEQQTALQRGIHNELTRLQGATVKAIEGSAEQTLLQLENTTTKTLATLTQSVSNGFKEALINAMKEQLRAYQEAMRQQALESNEPLLAIQGTIETQLAELTSKVETPMTRLRDIMGQQYEVQTAINTRLSSLESSAGEATTALLAIKDKTNETMLALTDTVSQQIANGLMEQMRQQYQVYQEAIQKQALESNKSMLALQGNMETQLTTITNTAAAPLLTLQSALQRQQEMRDAIQDEIARLTSSSEASQKEIENSANKKLLELKDASDTVIESLKGAVKTKLTLALEAPLKEQLEEMNSIIRQQAIDAKEPLLAIKSSTESMLEQIQDTSQEPMIILHDLVAKQRAFQDEILALQGTAAEDNLRALKTASDAAMDAISGVANREMDAAIGQLNKLKDEIEEQSGQVNSMLHQFNAAGTSNLQLQGRMERAVMGLEETLGKIVATQETVQQLALGDADSEARLKELQAHVDAKVTAVEATLNQVTSAVVPRQMAITEAPSGESSTDEYVADTKLERPTKRVREGTPPLSASDVIESGMDDVLRGGTEEIAVDTGNIIEHNWEVKFATSAAYHVKYESQKKNYKDGNYTPHNFATDFPDEFKLFKRVGDVDELPDGHMDEWKDEDASKYTYAEKIRMLRTGDAKCAHLFAKTFQQKRQKFKETYEDMATNWRFYNQATRKTRTLWRAQKIKKIETEIKNNLDVLKNRNPSEEYNALYSQDNPAAIQSWITSEVGHTKENYFLYNRDTVERWRLTKIEELDTLLQTEQFTILEEPSRRKPVNRIPAKLKAASKNRKKRDAEPKEDSILAQYKTEHEVYGMTDEDILASLNFQRYRRKLKAQRGQEEGAARGGYNDSRLV